MTQVVQGVLTQIKARSGTNARGPWTAYSIAVDTGVKDWTWIRYGFKAPEAKEGSVIKVEVDADDKGNLQAVAGSLVVDKSAKPTVATAVAAGKDAVQDSIVRQNATGIAIRVVKDMIDLGILPLPKTKADQYDAYLKYIDEVTDRFFLANRNAKTVDDVRKDAPEEEQADTPDEEDMWGAPE